jgi:hypothetical protein
MALFGHAAISELSLLSGVKRIERAKGSFWREAVVGTMSDMERPLSGVVQTWLGGPSISAFDPQPSCAEDIYDAAFARAVSAATIET